MRESARSLTLRTRPGSAGRSEEHTSELQSQSNLVCRLLLEKKNRHDIIACAYRDVASWLTSSRLYSQLPSTPSSRSSDRNIKLAPSCSAHRSTNATLTSRV